MRHSGTFSTHSSTGTVQYVQWVGEGDMMEQIWRSAISEGPLLAQIRGSWKKKKRSSAQCAVLRKVEWLNEGAYSRECVQHEVDVRNFTSESGGRGCIYDFNSLISRLCHYYAIASEKFICFLWSAVDGRMMKHKPCFWRNAPQSGPCTRLPALDYNWAPARCCAQPHLGQTEKPRVDGVSSVE